MFIKSHRIIEKAPITGAAKRYRPFREEKGPRAVYEAGLVFKSKKPGRSRSSTGQERYAVR